VLYSLDGRRIYAGSADGHTRVYQAGSGALVQTIGVHSGGVPAVGFSPHGTRMYSGSRDTTARAFSTASGQVLLTFSGHTDVINALAVSPDNSRLATAAGSPFPDTRDPSVRIWDTASGALLLTLAGHTNGSTGVAFSADGQALVSVGRDGQVRVWKVADGSLLQTTKSSSNALSTLSPGPGGGSFAIGSQDGKASLWQWSANSVSQLRALAATASGNAIAALAISGDGETIAAALEAYGDNIQLWQASDGSSLGTLAGDPDGFMQAVAFAPDGSALAAGSGYSRRLQLWDVPSETLLFQYDQETGWGPSPLFAVTFSPDSSLIGIGRTDATVEAARTPLGAAAQ